MVSSSRMLDAAKRRVLLPGSATGSSGRQRAAMGPSASSREPRRGSPLRLGALFAIVLLCATLSLTSLVWRSSARPVRGPIFRGSIANVAQKRDAVRDAMRFVWKNYHELAFGADEMEPMRGNALNPWGHVGCMILDSMDTLWIMELKEEFEQARRWVREDLRFDQMRAVSVFETIIRSLGGLLSAYDLSRDRIFLSKAVELAELMLPAIDPVTGRAKYQIDTRTGKGYQAGGLAESGTYQLEFEYLSIATGDSKYSTIADKLYPYLRDQDRIRYFGLFANEIYAFDGEEVRAGGAHTLTLSLGGSGDSFYEYLLKVWILKGEQQNSLLKQMYLDAVDGIEEVLLAETSKGQLFIGEYEIDSQRFTPKFQHLACFVPGLLSLGAKRLEHDDPQRSDRHLMTAKRLMKTCYEELYARQPTGLSPEYLTGPDLNSGMDPQYLLRPEVVESLYIMHQLTGDPLYQQWGWNIFVAIETHCKTPLAYSGLRNVANNEDLSAILDPRQHKWALERVQNDQMETFFTAETLKYLFLLFDGGNKHVSLETHVFNTEAHPLTIPR